MPNKIEWAAKVGGGLGLFPNLAGAPAGSVLARQQDGCRVLLAPDSTGELVVVRYLHGPDWRGEMERLGILDKRIVRIRENPDDRWAKGPCPRDLEPYIGKPIPEELRGRVGSVVGVRPDVYKYAYLVLLQLHRRKGDTTPGQPRKPREKIEVPFIWLEAVPEEPAHGNP